MQALGVDPGMLASEAVKATLRSNTDAALSAGIFGVPMLVVGNALFWGNDVHAFAMETLRDPELLNDPEMQRIASLPIAIHR